MRKTAAVFCSFLVSAVGFAQSQKDVREKEFKEETARYGPMAQEAVKRLRAAGVDVDGFLAASKQFVALGPEKGKAFAQQTNAKYGSPIRKALATALVLPGAADILQDVQRSPLGPTPLPPGPPPPPCASCSTATFQPPFVGTSTEGDNFTRAVNPTILVTTLSPSVRSAIAAAPHRKITTGKDFTVPSNSCHIRVDIPLDTSWVIGLSGVGYAHVWLGLDTSVQRGGAGATVCSAPHLEQDNQWTWLGGALTLSDHRPGPHIVRTCEFDRTPADPTTYTAKVGASVDGTFVGFSGGYGDYFVTLDGVAVTSCACAR
jgi:hypothetical protein